MSQFVRQHGLLLVGAQPIQKVHSPGFGIVIARDLLFQQHHQKFSQIKILGSNPNFLRTNSDRRRRLASSSSPVC